jgi:putative transposase
MAYKFKLKLNDKQKAAIANYGGSTRFLWNKALSINLERLKNKQHILYYQELDFFSKLWKKSEEYGFLKECPSQTIQQKLRDLEKAFKDCFDKKQPLKRLPRFKKKGCGDSFRYPQGFKVSGNQVFLPKLGWIRFRKSRDILGVIKNITIGGNGNNWYVSIQVEQEVTKPTHPSKSIVGIDVGIARFATLSTGEHIEPINSYKILMEKLKKSQRALSRKKKSSNNRKKAKIELQRVHSKIANVRRDFLQKSSTAISKNHAMIVMEDLKVTNMSKSAKGSIDEPGKSVRAKSGLNRAILDQSWSEFKRQLIYKQEWLGGDVLVVPPHNTSITCPSCNHKSKENRVTQSNFKCKSCDYRNNADVVGAINILRLGHSRLACGEKLLNVVDIGDISSQAQESPMVAA